jgi:hypothetical protein
MGRTIPSFRIAEILENSKWRKFRNTLCRGDRIIFDEMLSSARLYVSASSFALRTSVFEGVAIAIIFNHYMKLDSCIKKVMKIKERNNGIV